MGKCLGMALPCPLSPAWGWGTKDSPPMGLFLLYFLYSPFLKIRGEAMESLVSRVLPCPKSLPTWEHGGGARDSPCKRPSPMYLKVPWLTLLYYDILQYLKMTNIGPFHNLNSNFSNSAIHSLMLVTFRMVGPLPLSSLSRHSNCPASSRSWEEWFVWSYNIHLSYNQIFTSFPAWELVVVPVGTAIGDSRVRVFPSDLGGPINSSKCNTT
jgi:hypothetical protein